MKPLSLLIDARKLGDGGIGIYIENLVEGLLGEIRNGFPLRIRLITPPTLKGDGAAALARWGDKVSIVEDSARKYSFDEHFFLPRRLKGAFRDAEIFHSPHYTLPRGIKIPTVVTVHDAIHVLAPENFRQKLFGGRLMRSALRRANHVLTVSAVSLARLSRIVPGVPISVIPNALAPGHGVRPFHTVGKTILKYKLRQPYLLFVGSDRPHKGFDELIGALEISEDFAPMLVVVGDRFSKKVRERTLRRLGERRVEFLGALDRAEVSALYNGARAVVVPSRIEGFGLVALEAMASGAPLICSPEQSLNEVAGNAAWYTDDFSGASIAEGLRQCLQQRELAEEKAALGLNRAETFSIDRVAKEHLGVYLGVVSEGRYRELLGELPEQKMIISYAPHHSEQPQIAVQ